MEGPSNGNGTPDSTSSCKENAPAAGTKRPAPSGASPEKPKEKRRIMPVGVAPAAATTHQPIASTAVATPEQTKAIDYSDDEEEDAAHREHLRNELSEAECQVLIDNYFMAKQAHDDALEMLVYGPDTRKLGERHPDVSAERVRMEKRALRALHADKSLDPNSEAFLDALDEAMAEIVERLEEEVEETERAYTEASDEAEAAGFSIVLLERKYEDWDGQSSPSGAGPSHEPAAGGEESGEGEGGEEEEESESEEEDEEEGEDAVMHDASVKTEGDVKVELCYKCSARSALPALPGADSESHGLCYVCAAEKELDQRAPLEIHHGKVQEKGASGFTGWTAGLRRTSDPALLKKMYKAKRPDEVAKLTALNDAFANDGAFEIDEVARLSDEDGEGEDDGESDSDDDSDDGGLAAMAGKKPDKRQVRKKTKAALEAEGDLSHLVFNRRKTKKGGKKDKGGAAAAAADSDKSKKRGLYKGSDCTGCRAPLYECVDVYSHPILNVSLCFYCMLDCGGGGNPITSAAAAAAPSKKKAPVKEAEVCLWCAGNSPSADKNSLLLCDVAGCGKAICEGCVRLNLGPEMLDMVKETDPWSCFSCDGTPLAPLKEACASEQAARKDAKEKKAEAAKKAAERLKKKQAEEEAGKAKEEADAAKKKKAGSSSLSPAVTFESPKLQQRAEMSTEMSDLVLWPSFTERKQVKRNQQGADGSAGNVKPAVTVAPFLASELKPHQWEGIQFIWNALLGEKRPEAMSSTSRKKEHGVVLAHSMGLGKTLSVITFLHTALTRARNEKNIDYIQMKMVDHGKGSGEILEDERIRPSNALVLVPKAVATQWSYEWKRWVNKHDDTVKSYQFPTGGSRDAIMQTLRLWRNCGGILIMGHDAFWRVLQKKKEKNANNADGAGGSGLWEFASNFENDDPKILAEIESYLLKPGPDVFVMDEAHRIKNEQATLSKALARVDTKRRILLTGTPLQNNLMEYFHMVDFVKPGYLGDSKTFKTLFVESINKGAVQIDDEHKKKRKQAMDKRVWTLTKKLDRLVQRRGVEILSRTLPERFDIVLTVRLSETQRELYNEAVRRVAGSASVFSFNHTLRRIFDHPAMLLLNERITATKGTREKGAAKVVSAAKAAQAAAALADGEDMPVVEDTAVQTLGSKWWEHVWTTSDLTPAQTVSPDLSGKVALTLEILKLAVENDEKVLLFTQSLESLSILEEALKHAPSPRSPGATGWQKGLDYLRFDGSIDQDERDTMISHFADRSLKLRLFLISTRAGGTGLNLAAASRIIVFDASWNPAVDTQAVFRSYRYGQTRPVYVYRFIAEGFEQCLYRQQVVKLQLAGRVLDEQNHEAQFNHQELKDLWREIPMTGPIPTSQFDAASKSLPSASWVDQLVNGHGGTWLKGIDDHDKRLEGEEGELNSYEMEDAENDLRRDENELPRESAICGMCGHNHVGLIPWSTFVLKCRRPECNAETILCPAAPVVRRMQAPGHLHFAIHGEDATAGKTAIPKPGAGYHVQWRSLGEDPNADMTTADADGWCHPKRMIKPSSVISKKNLNVKFQYQVRVRARLGPCLCGHGELGGPNAKDYGYCICGSEDNSSGCQWTPWSPPSAPATPGGEEVAPAFQEPPKPAPPPAPPPKAKSPTEPPPPIEWPKPQVPSREASSDSNGQPLPPPAPATVKREGQFLPIPVQAAPPLAPQVVMPQVMPQGSVPYQLPVAQRVPSQPAAQRVPSQPAAQRVPSQPMMQAAQPVAVPLPPGAVPMQVPMMWVPGQQGAQAQPPWSQRTAPDLNKGK